MVTRGKDEVEWRRAQERWAEGETDKAGRVRHLGVGAEKSRDWGGAETGERQEAIEN